jgi:oxygen-independent coproporphyrinogen-3 oxidase
MSPANRQNFAQLGITAETLAAYDKRIPRYTSYPMAPVWTEDFQGPQWDAHLAAKAATTRDLSLYVHIPFCQKRCLFCACNVIATRHEGVADKYLDDVELEVRLARRHLHDDNRVIQLHLGGGTPNYLNDAEMGRLIGLLRSEFSFSGQIEQSIEVDPRIATREEIFRLHQRDGFNRISFGVQDFSDATQHAIGREQGRDASFNNVQAARDAGFRSVNIDLIYGLPKQTAQTWSDTMDCVCELKPDRLALYNFAWLPGKLPHQKKLKAEDMPSAELRVEMFIEAHNRLTANGWRYLGMDHYARETDSLTRAFEAGTMRRNFMGYTTLRGTDLLGFGVSAISDFAGAFSQNTKKLNVYHDELVKGIFPLERGMLLSEDDLLRRECIESLMCQARLDRHDERMARLIDEVREPLEELERDGLVELNDEALLVTLKGQVFLRNIAVLFDAYMNRLAKNPVFSRAV